MSDRKTIHLKVSVDTTDLDKLEAQLKRIKELMGSAGLKQPASVGFSADKFFITNGQVFIDEALISKAAPMPTIKYTVSGLHSDEYKEDLKQAVKQAIRPVIRQHIKVERSESTLKSSATVARLDEAVSHKETEFDQYKQQVEARFDELQSQLTHAQCTSAASEQSTAQYLSGLQRQITQLNKELEEMRLKDSANTDSIISLRQAMEQQEKSLAETIKRTIAEDLCRGGTLSRML
ncbi:TPA: hypothetical protein U2J46_004050 [Providencia stuartii]|uniref:hypothetical protein n=1 Tax=Providencia stuartii TaxID=588 RepID=UPI000CFFFF41|nr:hypothetical protein CEP70_12735 [Providencia stuartii]EMD1719105.1 hypothetical protein [Providencia stuartii]HEM7519625.1 hypothetical protein [Providencia stuartii]